MARRRLSSLILGVLLAAALSMPAAAADPPLPDSMAAVGDSISQAASSAGSLGADAPQNAWSTGTSGTVNSHYLRLVAAGAPISGQNHNRSVSGAKMGDLAGQMQTVVSLAPDYVTVLMGGNDLCTDTVSQMTDTQVFRDQFAAAMSTLTVGSPTTSVYVVSIPNVHQLWNLFKGNWWARLVWSSAGICQSLLANPTSTQQADVDRREASPTTPPSPRCARSTRTAASTATRSSTRRSRPATSRATTSTHRSRGRRSWRRSAGPPASRGPRPPRRRCG
jgi:hypothetical protein